MLKLLPIAKSCPFATDVYSLKLKGRIDKYKICLNVVDINDSEAIKKKKKKIRSYILLNLCVETVGET